MTITRYRSDGVVELQGFTVTLDPEGRIQKPNGSARAALGVTDRLAGASWFDTLVPPDDRAAARAAFSQWLGGEPAPELQLTRLLRADGQPMAVLTRWSVSDGEVRCTAIVVPTPLDLGALRSPRLDELNDMRTALDVSSIVAFTDAAGVITFANRKFCEISKYTAAELVGRTHRVINSGAHPAQFFRDLWRTIVSGEVWQGDIQNRAKDGSLYWVATTIVPFMGPDGRPVQYLAIRNDITERKRMEAELVAANRRIREEQLQVVQAEKMSSIGLLASGVAHEINNPLAGVMACVKALRDDELEPGRSEEYFAAVVDGLERIQQTVRGLLDYSRQRSPQPTRVEVDGVVSSALLLVSPAVRKKDLTIETGGVHALALRCDRSQLMQALVNVLLNAVYAAPERGHVWVELTEAGERVGIAVLDDGPGIKPDLINRVCDPFFTTKPEGEGTGLGLAVTMSLLRANGGDLGIEAAPGGGAKFTLWLPRGAED